MEVRERKAPAVVPVVEAMPEEELVVPEAGVETTTPMSRTPTPTTWMRMKKMISWMTQVKDRQARNTAGRQQLASHGKDVRQVLPSFPGEC